MRSRSVVRSRRAPHEAGALHRVACTIGLVALVGALAAASTRPAAEQPAPSRAAAPRNLDTATIATTLTMDR